MSEIVKQYVNNAVNFIHELKSEGKAPSLIEMSEDVFMLILDSESCFQIYSESQYERTFLGLPIKILKDKTEYLQVV